MTYGGFQSVTPCTRDTDVNNITVYNVYGKTAAPTRTISVHSRRRYASARSKPIAGETPSTSSGAVDILT